MRSYLCAMWVVYILKCNDDSYYTGITNDIDRRVKEHISGKGSRYTRSHLPVELLDFVHVADRTTALRLEARVKRVPRAGKLEFLRASATAAQEAV